MTQKVHQETPTAEKHFQQSSRVQKSVGFLYINNKRTEKRKQRNTFHNGLKKIYLKVIQTKQMKDLYDKDFKILKKKLKISAGGKVSHAYRLVELIQ